MTAETDERRLRKRYSQASRLLRIYLALANTREGLTVPELVERMGVSRRTIHRDLAALQEQHLITAPRVDDMLRKRWRLLPAGTVSTIGFTKGELMTLYLSRSWFAFAKGTPLYDAMQEVFHKVRSRLASTPGTELERLEHKLYAVPDAPLLHEDPERYDDCINEVLTALLHEQPLELTYPDRDSGAPRARRVVPLTLAHWRSRLYLLGEQAGGEIRPFALHRVLDAVRIRGEQAGGPRGFDPERFFSGQFGMWRGSEPTRVRVRFHGSAARYATERLWHPTQRVLARDDGGVELHWELAVTPDLESWILGFGDAAEVVAPSSLRRRIRDRLLDAARRYDEGGRR